MNLVIDGHNLAYRVLYALPKLTAGENENDTAVTFGFVRSLVGYLRFCSSNPKVWVAWDRGNGRRKAINPSYKANRALHEKSPWLIQLQGILPLLGVSQVSCEGEEADDVVSSLLPHLEGPVVIVTRDADYLQLVSDRVTVISPGPKGTNAIYDPEKVLMEWGVKPETIPSLKSFVGDPSDNIQGIPRFPVKVAASLLRDYATVDGVYQSGFPGVTKKQYASLKENESLVRSNLLLTVMVNDLSYVTEPPTPNRDSAVQQLTDLGFKNVSAMVDPFFPSKQGFLKFGLFFVGV